MVNANAQNNNQSLSHNAGSRSLASSSAEVTLSASSSLRTTSAIKPSPTKAAPATRTFFDPWNSSSTGHQRAENRLSGSTSWRDSRNLKLGEQYRGGVTGGKRVADTVGAGSADFGKDGRKENGGWERGAKGLRTGGQRSLAEAWAAGRSRGVESHGNNSRVHSNALSTRHRASPTPEHLSNSASDYDEIDVPTSAQVDIERDSATSSHQPPKQIFSGLCFYVNGSTAPLVSDHKLKQLIAAHGANSSIAFGRRSVTHVILGSSSREGRAGGGLAASKIQKEIVRAGGRPVKFVTAEW